MTARRSNRKPKERGTEDKTLPVARGSLWLHELKSRVFRNTRTLRVWLPSEYDGWGETRYPVLYLNDGQNLFDAATAFAGVSWQAGETAGKLIAEKKIPPLIVVGIDHAGKSRAREYIPYRSAESRATRPRGQRYPEFLEQEVIPLVEAYYSVAKGPENRGLGGSSLGGLIALYTELAAPGVFGRLLIESPSLYVANHRILEECRRLQRWPTRIYLGTGTREVGDLEKDEKIVGDVRTLEKILRATGLDGERLKVEIAEGAEHSESSWALRFPAALEFLFAS
jgi:predicted alpha/beta superfamily hydrolase